MKRYRVQEIKLALGERESVIPEKIAKKYRKAKLKVSDINDIVVVRKSFDARGDEVKKVYTLDFSCDKNLDLPVAPEFNYDIPFLSASKIEDGRRPIIIGFGPCGMFCALVLARAGLKPIVLERGQDVDTRIQKVEEFWKTGKLDPECNVQFGEGGAGTFSDGKLNTGIKDNAYYWNELSKCVNVYCDLKAVCSDLDSLNIGGGFPIKSSLVADYDYEYMTEEVISQIKTICNQRGVAEPQIFSEFGSFTVGESGEDSSIFNNTATSGTSTALPGQVGNAAGVNTKGEDGFYAFGESTSLIFSGRKYGAGGGCGGNNSYGNYATWAGSTAGGATGAGNGSNSTSAPAAATANTGAGGGGGYYSVINGGIYGAVGQGGSGIIIIRNAR